MASIERTAYPHFKRSPSARELEALYTPTTDELSFARTIARKAQPQFGLLLLLKAFQRLGYFPAVDEIPAAIVQHVRIAAEIDLETPPVYAELRTLYRHHQAIQERLGVSVRGEQGLRVGSEAMAAAAEVMDNPPDLIDVAIEELVCQRIELPAFSTLDRLSRRVCALVQGTHQSRRRRSHPSEKQYLRRQSHSQSPPNAQSPNCAFAFGDQPYVLVGI